MLKELETGSGSKIEGKEKVGKQTVIIKIGGGKDINLKNCRDDIAGLVHSGARLVLVHGGSHEANMLSERLGYPPRFVTLTSGHETRYTDRETLAIFEMAYCGKVNKEIVERLQQLGVNAIGLSGMDGRLLEGRRKESLRVRSGEKTLILHDNYTGEVQSVNGQLLNLLLSAGYFPVISPPAISSEGEAINVDGDRCAQLIAEALEASNLIYLIDRKGVLRDVKDESSLIPQIEPEDLSAVSSKYAQGRMHIKLDAANQAIRHGIPQVIIADGRIKNPITKALSGDGTTIIEK